MTFGLSANFLKLKKKLKKLLFIFPFLIFSSYEMKSVYLVRVRRWFYSPMFLLQDKEEKQWYHTVEHTIVPLMKSHYQASHKLLEKACLLEVANLSNLYKVFERCWFLDCEWDLYSQQNPPCQVRETHSPIYSWVYIACINCGKWFIL